jgi:hypothetical protein
MLRDLWDLAGDSPISGKAHELTLGLKFAGMAVCDVGAMLHERGFRVIANREFQASFAPAKDWISTAASALNSSAKHGVLSEIDNQQLSDFPRVQERWTD